MTDEDNIAYRPKGIGITITDTQQVILEFDHGEIPDIILSHQSAKKVGSHVSSAADRVSKGFDDEKGL
jgi:hypothetical protein